MKKLVLLLILFPTIVFADPKTAPQTPGITAEVAASTYQPLDTDLTTYSGITPSANIQAVLGAANYAAIRTLLGLGTVYQYDVGTGANNIPQLSGSPGTPDGTKFLRDDGTWQATAGSGDVTGVGDCASGACLDGTSDGGTYFRLYDGTANYLQGAISGALGSDKTLNLDTLISGASPTLDGTNFTGIPFAGLSDSVNIARLDQAETIAGAWAMGTPSSLTLTNATGLPLNGLTNPGADLTLSMNAYSLDFTFTNVLDFITVKSTVDNASIPLIKFEGDRTTMAANDEIYLPFFLSDSAGNQDEFFRFSAIAVDETTTTEDGGITFDFMVSGSLTQGFSLSSNGTNVDAVLTGGLTADSVTVARKANPTIVFGDSDTTDSDNNGTIDINCTDTGSGTEDCDMTFKQQVAGSLSAFMTVDADGSGTARIVFPNDSIGSAEIDTIVESMFWGAGGMSADGTQCLDPNETTINSGPKLYTAVCADNDSSTLYGHTVMPDSWDAGTVTFELEYIQTAADTNVLNSDIACMCRGAGETVNNTWGMEQAIDDAAVTGSNAVDHTTSAATTCDGTCAAGDTLFWRWQIDAAGTTTAVATLHMTGMKMEYTSNVGD